MKIPKIKICGITRTEEADFLNQAKADYAGFVFYGKSKRNISFAQAREMQSRLSPDIQRVAVTVSPNISLYEQIEESGFDILQVHGLLSREILEKSNLPVWRACNIEKAGDLERLEYHPKIAAYVVDAGNAGGGKTFDWQSCQGAAKWKEQYFQGKTFVLAGGLCSRNVREGIKLFRPDAVDVSSGVEKPVSGEEMQGISGKQKMFRKDKNMIFDFVNAVRLLEER